MIVCCCLACFSLVEPLASPQLPELTALDLGIQFTYRGVAIDLGAGHSLGRDSVHIEVFRCYLGNLVLLAGDRPVGRAEKPRALVDAAVSESLRLRFSGPGDELPDRLEFDLGVDSLTNVSGVFGGDLDPTNGMYWSWQSGYINLKIEGTSPACPARHHRFQFHAGGYRAPHATTQRISLPIRPGAGRELVLEIALDEILDPIDLRTTYQLMRPGAGAVDLSASAARAFHLRP